MPQIPASKGRQPVSYTHLDVYKRQDFVLFAVPIAIICARIYYVIFEWEYYSQDLSRIFAIREGGLAIYGGVIGGVVTAIVFCKIQKFPLLKLMDFAMPRDVYKRQIHICRVTIYHL